MKNETGDRFGELMAASNAAGEGRDCAVLALAVVAGVPYDTAWNALDAAGREPCKGTYRRTWKRAAATLGLELDEQTDDIRRRAKTVRTFERLGLPGSYLIRTSGHVLGYAGGKVHDWTRGRCHRIVDAYHVTRSR